MAEIQAFITGRAIEIVAGKVTNLFPAFNAHEYTNAWSTKFKLDEAAKGSYLAVPVEGKYRRENVVAALRVDGKLIGAQDRSVSFPSNVWEAPVSNEDEGNNTFYFPVTSEMIGKD